MTASKLRRVTLTGAILLLAGTAGAGIGVAVTTTGASPTAAPAATTAQPPEPAGMTTAGDATLAAIVEQAVDPSGDAAAASPAPAGLGAIRNRLGRWRALVRATMTVNLPQAGLQTFQVDHGTISAVGTSSVTLSEAGGRDVTITTGPSTRVRRDARQVQLSDLAVGDETIVFSRIGAGGSTTASAIVVPRLPAVPAAPAASPSPQAPTN